MEVDRSDEDEWESIVILCAVCVNKLKEEKSLKGHVKRNHKIMEPSLYRRMITKEKVLSVAFVILSSSSNSS